MEYETEVHIREKVQGPRGRMINLVSTRLKISFLGGVVDGEHTGLLCDTSPCRGVYISLMPDNVLCM